MYGVTYAFSYPEECPQGCWRGLPSHESKYIWGKWKENNMIVFPLLVEALVYSRCFHITFFFLEKSLFLRGVFWSHLWVKCTKILKVNSLVSETVKKKYDANNLLYTNFNTELHLIVYTLQIWITVALVSGFITPCRFSGSFFQQ